MLTVSQILAEFDKRSDDWEIYGQAYFCSDFAHSLAAALRPRHLRHEFRVRPHGARRWTVERRLRP